jgi:hypothetical protein
LQIIYAIGTGSVRDPLDPSDPAFFDSDDQLANLRVRDPVRAAIGVKALAPGDATARLQASGRIIESSVNDLAVARRSLEPDRVGTLEDENPVSSKRKRPTRRETDHPGAHHNAFNFVHHIHPASGWLWTVYPDTRVTSVKYLTQPILAALANRQQRYSLALRRRISAIEK